MQPHEEGVVTEQQELGDKLENLRAFIYSSSIFNSLPVDEQERLKTQEFFMSMYWRVLNDRILEFTAKYLNKKGESNG